ncbi:MAG: PAS domain S-box protein, partial [Anaerolineae bacterium]|nr:PAS domain S-box protein [Anaerolineae bacterium]
AHERFQGFGETGEFALARLEDDQIVFLLSHRHFDLENPASVPFASTIAEPMRRALSGASGTVIGLDYRGEVVLAAYEPVAEYGLGIVAKIDLAEVQAPFFRAGLLAGGVALLLILIGASSFWRISTPLLHHLEASERKFRTLFEGASDSITIINPATHRIVEANTRAASRLGYSEDELLHLTIDDIAEPLSDEHRQALETALQTQGSVIFEHTYRCQDGTAVPVEVSNQLITIGKQPLIQSVARDISERKQAEARRLELAVQQERIGILAAFVRDVAHEFRSPLSVLNTRLYLLTKTTDPAKHAEHIRVSREQTAYIAELVDAMLTMLRLQNRDAFEFAIIDLAQVIEVIMVAMRAQADAKGITMTLDLDGKSAIVCGDRQQLHLALTQLVKNAVQFTPESGTVTVQMRRQADQVVVAIRDTGAGIQPDDTPHVFEPFYRGDRARTTRGAGLGLAIAHRIVEAHQGTLAVESVIAEGSTFQVRLPAYQQPDPG